MIYINNFTISRYLSDIKTAFDDSQKTNIDYLLEDFVVGKTNWSVPKQTVPGDIVVFMCAKTARDNIGMATSHIPNYYGQSFHIFVNQQKALYRKYSGFILGYGIVASMPEKNMEYNWWMADIGQLHSFPNPVSIEEFRSFISINRTSSITYLNNSQWERLKWLVNQKNPGSFNNVVPPYAEVLDKEFTDAVQKKSSKPLNLLRKVAIKNASKPTSSIVQTKIYNRDSTVSAYVKKRANGSCQLCGNKAPFNDINGIPYLECHHIIWLSEGGMDSINNCVALCPNCHRRMHILSDTNDINLLKSKVK